MAVTAETVRAPSKALLMLEGRALYELGAFFAARPLLNLTPRGDGHPVFIVPGLVASDVSTRPLRDFLVSRNYDAHGWGLGRNYGLRHGIEDGMLDRIGELRRQHGRKVSLIGWSLGGVYARQLAKRVPDDVRLVITLGSPFAGHPRATNAWRLYEYTSGQKVDDRDNHVAGPLAAPPPVPTTAIFSRTDGVCAWQCCVEKPGPTTENIEVEGSHCGLGHHPAAVYAVADRLAQPEGKWRPFDRGGWRSMIFPNPAR